MSQSVHELITKYNSLIQRDHHKDRDCHFHIQRDWSYGELLGWCVVHYGYCYKENVDGESAYFPSYQAAEDHLVKLLTEWVKEEENRDLDI